MLKSPNDSKNYQTVTLKNGLRVLLIENNNSTKAAAALAVNVGHFSDPDNRQGLAHFLEHMLFLGTEKYPNDSEYQKFISQHGGHHNAWTATEHTCFFFDIPNAHFEQALDRFSQFFICPLLSKEAIEKERQNVDSEFKLKLKDDIRRLYDVHKETINQAHPFAKFSVGNNKTLSDKSDSSIQQELKTFFELYYNASSMTLAIEAPLPLNELKNLAEQKFSTISNNTTIPTLPDVPLYLSEHQQSYIQVKPVKNERQLILSFAMPSLDNLYVSKPDCILAYLLGHEGKGSILSYLKSKQWAFRLTAGSGISGYNFKDFNINIALTEEGEQHINSIIDAVFSYVNLLKSSDIDEYYFNEKRTTSLFSFKYQEPLKPVDSVSQLVMNMHYYPAEHYMFGDYILEDFNQLALKKLLDLFTIENLRISHISPNAETENISRWYQVPYQIKTIDKKLQQRWQKIAHIDNLQLPKPNEYITGEPRLVVPKKIKVKHPQIIKQNNGFTCWFKQDQSFYVPKGYIYLAINSLESIKSPANIAMTRLFTELYSDNVIEEHYDAELAGIHYHLYTHPTGVTLQTSGVSENQPLLLIKLLESLKNQKFNESKFLLFKQQLIKHWQNRDKSKSISQLFSLLSSAMQPNKPSTEELMNSLKEISFSDFEQFQQNLFKEISLELLIHGNWIKNNAKAIYTQVKSVFEGHYSKQFNVEINTTKVNGQTLIPAILPDHDHAAVVYYPIPDKSEKTTATTMVLSQLLSPHFFQTMRTEKQFGYLVGVGYVPINQYPGITFYIQSPETDANTLIKAIDEFIKNCIQLIEQIPDNVWQQLVEGLTSQLLEKDISLRIKSQRFWGAICNKDYEFNRKKRIINEIHQLTLDDIKQFIHKQLNQNLNQILLASIKEKKQITTMKQAVVNSVAEFHKKYPETY